MICRAGGRSARVTEYLNAERLGRGERRRRHVSTGRAQGRPLGRRQSTARSPRSSDCSRCDRCASTGWRPRHPAPTAPQPGARRAALQRPAVVSGPAALGFPAAGVALADGRAGYDRLSPPTRSTGPPAGPDRDELAVAARRRRPSGPPAARSGATCCCCSAGTARCPPTPSALSDAMVVSSVGRDLRRRR